MEEYDKLKAELEEVFSTLWLNRRTPPSVDIGIDRVRGYIKDGKIHLEIEIKDDIKVGSFESFEPGYYAERVR